MRPTTRGMLWITTAISVAIFAVWSGIPELLAIAVGSALVWLVSALLVLSGRRLEVRSFIPARAERDSDAAVSVSWQQSRRARSGLRFCDRRGRTVTGVRWGDSGEARLPVVTARRGLRAVGPWRMQRVDPWGLFIRHLADIDGGQVLITPRIHSVALATLPMAFTDHTGAADAGSTTFASLREYVVGDEMRHIHWRSSAKTGSLMTRQYIDVTRPRVHVVLVNDARAHRTDTDFEAAVDLTASIATVVRAAGFDVEVHTTGGDRAGRKGMIDLLSQVDRQATVAERNLLRLPAATTMVITGHGDRGWWERIPAAGLVRP
jgi:uncharacterized protein (DUF58 family)